MPDVQLEVIEDDPPIVEHELVDSSVLVVRGEKGDPGDDGQDGAPGSAGADSTVPGPPGAPGPPPAGTGTEIQYRGDSTHLAAIPGSSVAGQAVTFTAEDGTNQRVLVLNGDYPRIHIQGDGTDHFVDGNHIQGISFGGNYYFGIGANLESAGGAAILVQANGAVLIPNIQFGYIGPIGGGGADTFGRIEGNKIALKFGTDGGGEAGLRIYDQRDTGHHYSATVQVESADTTVPVAVVKARAGQTGPLLEAQTDAGVPLARVTAAGDVEVVTAGKGVILAAPNGTRYRLTVSNAGAAVMTAI